MKNLFRYILFFALAFIFGVAGAWVAGVTFSDVDYNSWYGNSVNRLRQLGVFNGYNDNTFRPGGYVNRAELAVILNNFLEKVGGDLASGRICMQDNTLYLTGEGFFNGCNGFTCQDNGRFVGTEIFCSKYGKKKQSWEYIDNKK